MKIFLLFITLFSAILFLLPMTALEPSGEPDLLSASAPSSAIRQELSDPAIKGESVRPAMETVEKSHYREPDHFSVLDRSNGEVLKIPIRDYLCGAVAAEMPPTYHPEALKAQAVASHTYGLYCHQHPAEDLAGADFSADPSAWQGYVTREQMLERYPKEGEAYWEAIAEAVDEVVSLVLFYEDEPVLAAYHAMSAGSTEYACNVWDGAVPYLIPADSSGDTLAQGYETVVRFSPEELRQSLALSFPELTLPEDPADWFRILSRSPSGYVLTVQVGNMTLSGQQLRQALGLRSSSFSVSPKEDGFLFTTLGYGHGVGLSQNGADYLARQGKSFSDILLHYYQGVTLCSID